MGRLLVRTVAALAIALLAAVGGRAFFAPAPEVADVAPPAPAAPKVAMQSVLVATRALSVGTFLDEVEVEVRALPRDGLPADVVTAEAATGVLGAVVIRAVGTDLPVRTGDLLLPGQDGFLAAVLAPGKRAVSIAVDAVSGNAGHVFPGDFVDLLLTHELTDGSGIDNPMRGYASETILEGVRVIAVDQDLASDLTARDPHGVPRTLTLEVSPQEAERVTVAGQIGNLSVSLRSLLIQEAPLLADDAAATRGPTWAGDVSAVVRAAARQPSPEDVAPPPMRQVRVLRGSATEVVDN